MNSKRLHGRVVKLTLALSLAASACNRPSFDRPTDAYASFHRLLQKGDAKSAYAVLSQRTRALLDARAKQVAEASSGTVKPEAHALLFAGAPRPNDITDISLAR